MRLLLCALLFLFYLVVSVTFALGTGSGTLLSEGSGSQFDESGSGQTLDETSCYGDISGIAITEVLPNPEGSDRGQEWIELVVPLSSELCDLRIAREDEVAVGQDLGTEWDIVEEVDRYGVGLGFGYVVLEPLSFTLRNSFDALVLLRISTGEVLQRVEWTDAPSGQSWTWIP